MELDEVSEAIGGLKAEVKNLNVGQTMLFKKHEEISKKMCGKIDRLHGDLSNIKLAHARKAGAMGVIAAIGSLGLVEGVKFWMRQN